MNQYTISIIIYIVLCLIVLFLAYRQHNMKIKQNEIIKSLETVRQGSVDLALVTIDLTTYIQELDQRIINIVKKDLTKVN